MKNLVILFTCFINISPSKSNTIAHCYKRSNKIPLIFIISVIIMQCFTVKSYSQTVTKANNIIYLDFGLFFAGGASAIGVGLNYERMLNDNISIRAGVNIGMLAAGRSGDAFSGSGIGFPVSVNYMTNNKNKFEIGAGAGPYIGFGNKKVNILPAVRLGYRYQTEEEGMMYRAGVEFPSNFYISLGGIGYQFK